MEKKSILWWTIFVLLAIWQLPQFLVAVFMLPFIGNLKLIAERHFNICFVGSEMAGGISLGPFAYISNGLNNSYKREEHIAHELDGHAKQSRLLGWFYIPLIGFESLLWAFFYNKEKHCYYSFYTEKTANYFAGLETDEYCNLKFKKS